jgi:hypothetical protein
VQSLADFLRSIAGVPPARIPEYERWASRFDSWWQGQKRASQLANLETRERFLRAFVNSTPPWMLSRAEHAVRIYVEFLRLRGVDGAPQP